FICPVYVFSFNHTSPPQIYTLSLHDALPISLNIELPPGVRIEDTAAVSAAAYRIVARQPEVTNVVESIGTDDIGDIRSGQLFISDRKSTRLNSSHLVISYAVFCLKKKTKKKT